MNQEKAKAISRVVISSENLCRIFSENPPSTKEEDDIKRRAWNLAREALNYARTRGYGFFDGSDTLIKKHGDKND